MATQWYSGHVAKAKRGVSGQLKKVGVMFGLAGARILYSLRGPMIDEVINQKLRVVILNKKDMSNLNGTSKWGQFFIDKGYYPVSVGAKCGKNLKKMEAVTIKATAEKSERERAKGLKSRTIRVMIIGIPSIGKSTLVNKLVKHNIAQTGNKPGVTKQWQWIKAGNALQLLDTPGIFWSKFRDEEVGKKLSLTGAIKDSIMHLDEAAIYGLNSLVQSNLARLESHYNTKVPEDVEIIAWLDAARKKYGLTRRGNEIDYEAVIELIIYDVRNVKIGNYCFDIFKDMTEESANDANNWRNYAAD